MYFYAYYLMGSVNLKIQRYLSAWKRTLICLPMWVWDVC